MNDYPAMIATINQVEPVPRRIRGYLAGEKVLDTVQALYVWEWANYPQYYIPLADVRKDVLVDEQHVLQTRRGSVQLHGLQVGETRREGAARVVVNSPVDGLNGGLLHRLGVHAIDHGARHAIAIRAPPKLWNSGFQPAGD